jgi:hypothetical protein
MRTAGLVLTILGGFVAFFTSLLFGLIVIGLGLIIISLNEEGIDVSKPAKSNSVLAYKEKTSGYFYWSKTKLGKWSNLVNTIFIFIGVLSLLVTFAYGTIDAEVEDIKDFNCGVAVLITDFFLEPLFNNRAMYEDFCINK